MGRRKIYNWLLIGILATISATLGFYISPADDLSSDTRVRDVTLYYYNQSEDIKLSQGENVLCSSEAVLPVSRELPLTQTPIQDTVRLLLKGELTSEEESAGFMTEFPLADLELIGANLKNRMLTLEFEDPNNLTTGGSCRVSLLWAQIFKTAKQFPEVKEVKFIPEELFQP